MPGNTTRPRAAVVADVRRGGSAALGAPRGAAWTTVVLLVAALGAAILWGANPTSRAAARDDGALRLHLPFALTGPRDIRGNERTTRSYRAISPHAPQPISEPNHIAARARAIAAPRSRVLGVGSDTLRIAATRSAASRSRCRSVRRSHRGRPRSCRAPAFEPRLTCRPAFWRSV